MLEAWKTLPIPLIHLSNWSIEIEWLRKLYIFGLKERKKKEVKLLALQHNKVVGTGFCDIDPDSRNRLSIADSDIHQISLIFFFLIYSSPFAAKAYCYEMNCCGGCVEIAWMTFFSFVMQCAMETQSSTTGSGSWMKAASSSPDVPRSALYKSSSSITAPMRTACASTSANHAFRYVSPVAHMQMKEHWFDNGIIADRETGDGGNVVQHARPVGDW